MSLNKAQLIGNLGRDAELKYTSTGLAVATFSMATTEVWRDKDANGKPTGPQKEKTEWHRCVVWGSMAENLAQYLVKGKQVYVEGRLQTRQWEKDGQKHYSTVIRADRIQLLGSKKGGGSGSSVPHPAETAVPDDDSDIPF